VHLVVGCRGGRDRYKRPEAGRVAVTADTTILTSDSPGDEDPRAIVDQMLTGALECPDRQVVVELDRATAISLAIAVARPGDVVLVVGRGHETSQHIGGRDLPFDDREHARTVLAARGWGAVGGRLPRRPAARLGLTTTACDFSHGMADSIPIGFTDSADGVSPRAVPPRTTGHRSVSSG
jgi:UDP-N-acetylmuramoyl-L-alanyl-D-glutamate--2,6-diaminopimelate ligase